MNELRSKAVALLILVPGLVIATHFGTFRVMADIWMRSDTFAHGLIVGPMFLYFVFRQRHALARIAPQPYWPGLIALLLISIVWTAGRFLGVNALEHFAAVAMIPLTVLTLAGPVVVRAVAFPLAFLFFAVPFGEFLIPQLMEVTADLTHWLLLLTGFSVYRDGFFIAVPGGDFEIAKACSGIRYLIASVVLGTIFAYLTFNTWRKRIIFMGFSILVPVIANGIRAYMIVVLASLSGMRLAVGIDHFIYGWVFFGIVMFILFGVGVRFRDDQEAEPSGPPAVPVNIDQPTRPVAMILALVAIVMLTGPLLLFVVNMRDSGVTEVQLAELPAGWRVTDSSSGWQPAIATADQSLRRATTNGSVTIYEFVDVYDPSNGGVDAASSVNRLVDQKNWRVARSLPSPDENMRIVLVRQGRSNMYVVSWYQNGGKRTTSPLRAKLAEAKDTLINGGSTSALVAFAIDAGDGSDSSNLDLLVRYLADYYSALANCLANPGTATACAG